MAHSFEPRDLAFAQMLAGKISAIDFGETRPIDFARDQVATLAAHVGKYRHEQCRADLVEIVTLVVEMRSAQKEYFRSRSSTALDRSKRAERSVDEALAALASPRLF